MSAVSRLCAVSLALLGTGCVVVRPPADEELASELQELRVELRRQAELLRATRRTLDALRTAVGRMERRLCSGSGDLGGCCPSRAQTLRRLRVELGAARALLRELAEPFRDRPPGTPRVH